jgi:hypothetical protein
MYALLWRTLPGGLVPKLLQLILIAGAVVLGLFELVFPWFAQTFLTEQSTVEG